MTDTRGSSNMWSTVSSANNKAQDSVEREEMGWITPSTVTTVVAACLVAWLLQIIAFSPISPGPSIFQSDYEPQAHFVKNNVLQTIEKLGEGFLEGPEDSAVDGNGLIYTATQDGWIKRMHPNGSWEDWKKVGGSLLGLAVSRSGHIIVCDPERGQSVGSPSRDPSAPFFVPSTSSEFSIGPSTFTRDFKLIRHDTSFVESINRGVATAMASLELLTEGLVTLDRLRAFEVDLQSDYLMLELEKSLNKRTIERVRKTPSSSSSPSTR